MPGKKIKTIVIMLGSLMIAAIPFAYAIASNTPDAQSPPKPPAWSAGEAATPEKTATSGAPAPDNNIDEDTLTLVNKQNALQGDYVPANFVVPSVRIASSNGDVKHMREDAASALELMFSSADKDGVSLYAVSGYRSYARQVSVFASSVKSHGSETEAKREFDAGGVSGQIKKKPP